MYVRYTCTLSMAYAPCQSGHEFKTVNTQRTNRHNFNNDKPNFIERREHCEIYLESKLKY